jgi:hypothetical protein
MNIMQMENGIMNITQEDKDLNAEKKELIKFK